MNAERKPKILVVDDEVNIRIAVSRWFTVGGFDVDEAEDGLIALEKCLDTDYDLVLMDLEMPRMGGHDALHAICGKKPGQRFIVVTGFSNEVDNPVVQQAIAILLKPISLVALEAEVRKALNML